MSTNRKTALCMVMTITLSACGGGAESGNSTPTTDITPVTTVVSKTIQPQVATDVSLLDRQKITEIKALASSSVAGQALTVNVADVGKQGMLIATDANDNPLLFSIENTSAIGIDSTAYALVVMVMKMEDLPADLNLGTVQSNIRQVSSYITLKSLLSENLSRSIAAIDSPEAIKLAFIVLDDAIRLNAPVVAFSARDNQIKTEINKSIFPHYLFNSGATNKMWLAGADISGIELKNRTFLRWQVVLKNKDGQQIYKDHITPMETTTAQLYAYYGDSESSIKIPSALINDRFKIEVSQTPQTETANALALVAKSVFAIVDFSLGAAGVKPTQVQDCATTVTNTLINSSQFGAAVTSTNIQNWIAYFESIGGRVPELFTTCSSQLDDGFGLANANSTFKVFFYRFNKALSVARDASGAINGFVQFNTHHNKVYTTDLCFKNGQISEFCNDGVYSLEFSLPASLTVGQKGTLSALAKDVNGNIINELSSIIFTSTNTDIIKISGSTFTVLKDGIAEVIAMDTVSGVTTTSSRIVASSNGILSGHVSCKIIDVGVNENANTVRFSGTVRLAPFQRMYVTGASRDIENFDPSSPFNSFYKSPGSSIIPQIYNNSTTLNDQDFDLEYNIIVSGGSRHNTLIILIGNSETGYKTDYQFDKYSCQL